MTVVTAKLKFHLKTGLVMIHFRHVFCHVLPLPYEWKHSSGSQKYNGEPEEWFYCYKNHTGNQFTGPELSDIPDFTTN